METNKVNDIYNKVKELTAVNKVKWQEINNSSSSKGYQCVLGDYLIKVQSGGFSDSFKILDTNGVELGSLTDSSLTSKVNYNIREFMTLVHKKVNRIDDKLDDFLNQLGKM